MTSRIDVERVLAVALARALNQVVLEHVRGLVGTLQQLDQRRPFRHILRISQICQQLPLFMRIPHSRGGW